VSGLSDLLRHLRLFNNLSFSSRVFLTTFPDRIGTLTNNLFVTISAVYFGVTPPILSSVVGNSFLVNNTLLAGGRVSVTVDKFGESLFNANIQGNSFILAHDAIKLAIAGLFKSASMSFSVEPKDLFRSAIPPSLRGVFDSFRSTLSSGLHEYKKHILVPDLLFKYFDDASSAFVQSIIEVKTIQYSSSWYSSNVDLIGVSSREKCVAREYLAKARRADIRWCQAVSTSLGPIQTFLESFGGVRALIFGAFGESSTCYQDICRFVGFSRASKDGAGRLLNSDDLKLLASYHSAEARRVLAMAATKARGNFILNRVAFVIDPTHFDFQ